MSKKKSYTKFPNPKDFLNPFDLKVFKNKLVHYHIFSFRTFFKIMTHAFLKDDSRILTIISEHNKLYSSFKEPEVLESEEKMKEFMFMSHDLNEMKGEVDLDLTKTLTTEDFDDFDEDEIFDFTEVLDPDAIDIDELDFSYLDED